jgi:hypothetical protein
MFTRIALVLFVCSVSTFAIAQQPTTQPQHEDETLAETPAVVLKIRLSRRVVSSFYWVATW